MNLPDTHCLILSHALSPDDFNQFEKDYQQYQLDCLLNLSILLMADAVWMASLKGYFYQHTQKWWQKQQALFVMRDDLRRRALGRGDFFSQVVILNDLTFFPENTIYLTWPTCLW